MKYLSIIFALVVLLPATGVIAAGTYKVYHDPLPSPAWPNSHIEKYTVHGKYNTGNPQENDNQHPVPSQGPNTVIVFAPPKVPTSCGSFYCP